MPTFSWKAGPEQFPPNQLLEAAIAAEEAGFDAIETSDHFQPWSEAGQACFAWTWLGAVAARTQRIRMGPGVTCPILRYHPSVVAQAAATLDAMAPGRAYLCVGTGEALNEYAAMGQWPGYSTRQAMMKEAIELIRALWSGEEVSYTGEYYQTRKAKLFTRSQRPIPLYVSTLVPGSAYFAGYHGDGMITVGGKPPKIYQEMLSRFEEGARAAGKDPSTMPRLIELNVEFSDDAEAAVKWWQTYWAGSLVPALFNRKIYTPKLSQQNGKVVGKDTLQQKLCLSTDPQKHVDFAQQHLDLGFDSLIFHSANPDQQSFIQNYGKQVLPLLQKQPTSERV